MSAIISECGLYRYRLDRDCEPSIRLAPAEILKAPTFAYFGINPSTADAALDDATVRKWRGFTERNGGDHFIVGNVFSYRATDVRHLAGPIEPQGPLHHDHLMDIIREADVLVPCWGNSAKVPPRLRPAIYALVKLLVSSGKPVWHFGVTASGDPKHPLMLGYDTPLTPWVSP